MSRRAVTLASAGLVVVVLSAIAALLPVPYVALSPGPTSNTLGAVAGTDLIRISGHATYPDKGHLDLTTVSVLGGPRQRMDLVTALRGWLAGDVAVIPEDQVYPKGQSAKEAEQESAAEMRNSQENATTAALRSLDIPVTVRVTVAGVTDGAPAAGKLRAGDQVVAVDGSPVTSSTSLRSLITRHKPGEDVRLTVKRGGTQRDVTVGTTAADDGRAVVGITTEDHATYPFTVRISLKDVGGPSAGLMFALGVVDKLTPGSLTGGAYVAGTGTIDEEGNVGPIGGITQKILGAHRAGATIFLSPPGNCAEARSAAPSDVTLVKAKSLSSAVSSLEKLRKNPHAKVPTC